MTGAQPLAVSASRPTPGAITLSTRCADRGPEQARAAGGQRDGHRAAINEGRGVKIAQRQIVDHIDQRPRLAGFLRQLSRGAFHPRPDKDKPGALENQGQSARVSMRVSG
jgi:hypothetical protein